MGGVSGAKVRGYALLDVVLAVALFALTVTGLLGVLQRVNETSTAFAKDRLIQNRLATMLSETKQLDLSSMVSEVQDLDLDITFRTYVEDYQIDNGEGAELTDLYLLTAEAQFIDDGGEQIEKAAILIHQPES